MTETYSALDEEKKERVDVALDELIKEGFVTDDRGKHYLIVRHSNAYSKRKTPPRKRKTHLSAARSSPTF